MADPTGGSLGLVDIGGTKVLAGVCPRDGGRRGSGETPWGTPARRPTASDDPVGQLCSMLDEARGQRRLAAIALSVPGPFERDHPALINPPGMPPSWHGLRLGDELGARYGCPVLAENDANCAALAEAVHGAGRGHRTVVYYTVSTGIGSGVVRDGRLVISRHDTEGGHQVLWPPWLGGPRCDCGGAGCLEALASGRAIERRHGVAPQDLDDPSAWEEVGRWLGLAAVNTTALLDPDCIVLGGGVCGRWESFSPALFGTVGELLHLQPAPRIARASLGEDRNLWGALALARRGDVPAG